MATSLATHRTNRAAAGAAYATAAAAYLAAYVELKAYDLTVSNNLVGGGMQPTFPDTPAVVPHAEFVRDVNALTGGARVGALAHARHVQLLSS